MHKTNIVIMAAGQARRFGSAKQLADFNGKPLLQTVVDNCAAVAATEVYLILGAYYKRIEANLNLQRVHILKNEEWAEGIASSIRTAVRALQDQADSLLFLAGDQPLVNTAELQQLVNLGVANPDKICCASYGDTTGIPAIFPKEYYVELLTLQGDVGAKGILLNNEHDVITRNMPNAAVDIDYPLDGG